MDVCEYEFWLAEPYAQPPTHFMATSLTCLFHPSGIFRYHAEVLLVLILYLSVNVIRPCNLRTFDVLHDVLSTYFLTVLARMIVAPGSISCVGGCCWDMAMYFDAFAVFFAFAFSVYLFIALEARGNTKQWYRDFLSHYCFQVAEMIVAESSTFRNWSIEVNQAGSELVEYCILICALLLTVSTYLCTCNLWRWTVDYLDDTENTALILGATAAVNAMTAGFITAGSGWKIALIYVVAKIVILIALHFAVIVYTHCNLILNYRRDVVSKLSSKGRDVSRHYPASASRRVFACVLKQVRRELISSNRYGNNASQNVIAYSTEIPQMWKLPAEATQFLLELTLKQRGEELLQVLCSKRCNFLAPFRKYTSFLKFVEKEKPEWEEVVMRRYYQVLLLWMRKREVGLVRLPISLLLEVAALL